MNLVADFNTALAEGMTVKEICDKAGIEFHQLNAHLRDGTFTEELANAVHKIISAWREKKADMLATEGRIF